MGCNFTRRFAGGRLLFILAVLVLALMATVAQGQILNGTITGMVTDPSGAVVPKAKVIAVDVSTNREFTAFSASNGEFVIPNVPNGTYNVTVDATGFATFIARQVQVNVSQVARVDAKLSLGKAGTTVEVSSVQAVVETETSEVKYAVDRLQIMSLQLPNRNPLDLVRTLPGMITPTGGTGVTGGDVFVHGLRGNATNITLDGINIADNMVKTSGFFGINSPVVDSIGEFNVSVGAVGVDAGFGAAQVSMRTQRGTNALHGAVYWFQRNSFLNANLYFNKMSTPVTPRPFQLQNRLGFNVGGPVHMPGVYKGKNKTFFFASFEAYRQPSSQTRIRTVMTDTARRGLFTYTGSNDKALHTINLLTLPGATLGNTGLPVALNQNVIGPYNQLVPLPNSTSGCGADTYNLGCYAFNNSGSSRQNRYTGRLDHNLNDGQSVEFTYNQQNYFSGPDFLNNVDPQFPGQKGGGQESKRQLFSWALHSTFGPTKTNEARFGLTRSPVVFTLAENYRETNGQQLVLPNFLSNPMYVSGGRPQGRNTPVRQATDNFAWLKGHHTLRFGGEYRYISDESFAYNYTQYPRIDFVTVATPQSPAQSTGLLSTNTAQFPGGISAGDFTKAQSLFATLTGLLAVTRQGYVHTSPTSGYVSGEPSVRDPIQHNLAFYAQDSYKLRPNFTLEMGMRWEYQGVYNERNGLALLPKDGLAAAFGPAGMGNFFNVLNTPVMTDVQMQLVSGPNKIQPYKADWNNFAPFLGFAWDPFNDGKTSIRGGATMHYTQDGLTLIDNALSWADGLVTIPQNTAPTGLYNPASVPWPAVPVDSFSQKTNWANDPAAGIVAIKPDLATPYVMEWNLSVQREIGKRITLEARYVGNHAVKQYRLWDTDQINLYNNPFSYGGNNVANAYTEFMNARSNASLCGGKTMTCGVAGVQPLPILSALFAGVNPTYTWTYSTLLNLLTQGQPGAFFDYLRRQPYYQIDNPDPKKQWKNNLFTQFPLNFFVPNPWVYNSIIMDNSSWSYYHGLELEARRRFSGGLFFQMNYTWSRGISDQRFGTSQSEFQAYRDVSNPGLEKFRSPLDQRHAISANFIYPLPVGRGHSLGRNMPGALDKIVGGWQIQGMSRLASGSPFTISSSRWTTGVANGVSETAMLRNMDPKDLAKYIGTFKTAFGVFWLDPRSGLVTINQNGTSKPNLCASGQTTPCFDYPGPGQMGNTSFLQWTGPFFWNQDFSFIKQMPISSISEKFNVEFRLEMYNAFNHPIFASPTYTGTSGIASLNDTSKFGQLTALADTSRGGGVNSRNMAFQLRINF